MSTGEPGTRAAVTNTGDGTNAILNFVIPKGDTGVMGETDTLMATNTFAEVTSPCGPVTFASTPMTSGYAVTHMNGSADVRIKEPGVYLVNVNCTVKADTGTSVPALFQLSLLRDGTPIPGATAGHTFEHDNRSATIAFHATLRADEPATLKVVSNSMGFTIQNAAISVSRIGMLPS